MLTSGIYLLPLSFCDIGLEKSFVLQSKNHQTFLKVPIINFLLKDVFQIHDIRHQVQFCCSFC